MSSSQDKREPWQSRSRCVIRLPDGAPLIIIPDYCPGGSQCNCTSRTECRSIVPRVLAARLSSDSKFHSEYERFGIPAWCRGTDIFNNNAVEYSRIMQYSGPTPPLSNSPSAAYWISKRVADLVERKVTGEGTPGQDPRAKRK